eukprot:716309-Pyramimonas_sp.AAC.1
MRAHLGVGLSSKCAFACRSSTSITGASAAICVADPLADDAFPSSAIWLAARRRIISGEETSSGK